MYQSDRKNQFLRQHPVMVQTKTAIMNIFNWFDQYEYEQRTDLAEMPKDEVDRILQEYCKKKRSKFQVAESLLASYIKWCADEGLDVHPSHLKANEDLLVQDSEEIDAIRALLVGSPLDFKERLDECFKITEDETVNTIFRAYLWMAYLGIDEIDSFKITSEHILDDYSFIIYNDAVFRMYNECRDDIRLASTLDEYTSRHKNPDYIIKKARIAGNELLRLASTRSGVQHFRNAISKRSALYKTTLSYERVKLAGTYFRTYAEESFIEEFGNNKAVYSYWGRKPREKYARWKAAYSDSLKAYGKRK